MAWVHLLDDDEVEGEVREVFDRGRAQYGEVLEAWRAVAHCPDVFVAYPAYFRGITGEGHVDQRIKDLAAIRVALLNRCRYSLSHRVASARRIGVDDSDILGVADPARHGYDERTAAALALAEELTTGPALRRPEDTPQIVSDETRARVEAAFEDPARVELTLAICLWNALSRFHRVMALDLDMPEPPPELEAVLHA